MDPVKGSPNKGLNNSTEDDARPTEDTESNEHNINVDAIVAQNKRLFEEKRILEIKAKSVDVLTDLLEQSQREAADLRRQKQELLRSRKLISSQSGESEFGEMLLKFSPSPLDTKVRSSSPELTAKAAQDDEQTLSGLSWFSAWTTADAKNIEDIAAALDNLDDTLEQCLDAGDANEEASILEQLEALHAIIPEQDKNIRNEHWINDLISRFARLKTKLNHIVRKKSLSLAAMHEEIRKGKSEIKALQERIGTPVASPSADVLNQNDEPLKNLAKSSSPTESKLSANTSLASPRGETATARPKLLKMDEVHFESGPPGEAESHLQNRIADLEGKLEELMAVNRIWDQQYKKLQGQTAQELQQKDNEIASLRRSGSRADINHMLSEKEATISELRHQMRAVQQRQLYNAQDIELLQRKESEATRRCEITNQLYSEQLEHLHMLNKEYTTLQAKHNQVKSELTRLTSIIEASGQEHSSSPIRRTTSGSTTAGAEEIDLYKEQIKCYENDFKAEREEKSKVIKNLEKEVADWHRKATEMAHQLACREQELSEKHQKMKHLIGLQRQRSDIDKQLSAYGAEFRSYLPASPEPPNSTYPAREWLPTLNSRQLNGHQQPASQTGSTEIIYSEAEAVTRVPTTQNAQRQNSPVGWRLPKDSSIERNRSPVPRGGSTLFPPWETVISDSEERLT